MDGPRIAVLPDFLVDQIAAGEVVENPASVVKELLENALDAGARRVTIEVEGGGLGLVRITDDGHGMTAEEAPLALLRHATSKIRDAGDLEAIRTLGFRGEALPSIASVSRFELTTRTRDADVGVRIVAGNGRIEATPVACPAGTSISVRDLFCNVPARLKFQKGERSQVAALEDVVRRTALAHPAVHIVLSGTRRTPLDFPACPRLSDRVASVLGRDLAGRLHEVRAEEDGLLVSGVVGGPDLARPDPGRVVLLVNGRPVVDNPIRRAVVQAFSTLVEGGAYPLAVLDLALDPADVDVNVHPRKVEVRFRRHREVAGFVFGAVQSVVLGTPWIRPEEAPAGGGGSAGTYGRAWAPGLAETVAPAPGTSAALPDAATAPDLFRTAEPGGTWRFADLRYAGQVANTILVLEAPGALVLVDQHAAHERVNYERLTRDLAAGRLASAPLLFPEVVVVSPAERGRVDDARPVLERLGFDLEAYSGDSVAIRAVPAALRGRSAAAAVRDCLAAAGEESSGEGTARILKVLSTVACHASVRAGDPLAEPEVRALLAAMDTIDLASYCPHGRQAVVVRPMGEVLRWFGR